MTDLETLFQTHRQEYERKVQLCLQQQAAMPRKVSRTAQKRVPNRIRFWIGGQLIGAGQLLQARNGWSDAAHG